jgi:hypothetical protein
MAALGTGRRVRTGLFRVEVIAADAVEADLPALGIIKSPVPAIIINPEHDKRPEDQQAIEENAEYRIGGRNHGKELAR